MGVFAAGYADARRAALDAAAALVDAGRTRLGLLATDLEDSAHALATRLASAMLAAALVVIGVLCGGAALLLWVEPALRPALLAGFAVVAVAAGALLARSIRPRTERPAALFAATMDELALDRDALRRAASQT